jgi:HPt (histidine-containing phosphotransfer) domain-containing protein
MPQVQDDASFFLQTLGGGRLAPHHATDILAVLDGDAIDRLHDLATHVQRPGETLLADLTAMFAHDSAARCDRMRDACDAGDIDQIRKIAHAMKGAALNMGAKRVVACCVLLESAKDMDREALSRCIDDVAEVATEAAALWRRIATDTPR